MSDTGSAPGSVRDDVRSDRPFGVYLHVPFCASKCDYCAFATWTDRAHLIEEYLDAVETDVRRAVESGTLGRATSIFVGGGTPTLVPAERLAQVIAAVPVVDDVEITVECNPDDVTVPMLATYVDAGVNRVSIGVQSMVDRVLVSLGRRHDRSNVARAVDAVCEVGLPTFNLDVIYGAAGERVEDWAETMAAVVALDPPHVSAYGLTVEAGTPLAADPDRHPDDDDQATKYELADDALVAAGLENYEVSNWARPGHECRHNLLYWRQQDYLGFGCAAHSHRSGRRWWNLRTPERYVDAVRAGDSTEAAHEDLDADTRHIEGRQLELRMRDGVPIDAFTHADAAALAEYGLIERNEDRWRLTRSGRLLANEVAIRLR